MVQIWWNGAVSALVGTLQRVISTSVSMICDVNIVVENLEVIP